MQVGDTVHANINKETIAVKIAKISGDIVYVTPISAHSRHRFKQMSLGEPHEMNKKDLWIP